MGLTEPPPQVGLVLGLIFIEPSSLPDIPGQFAVFLEDYDIFSLSLPHIDLSRVQTEWKRLMSTIPEPWKLNTDGREFRIGDAIRARGLEAKYPVVLIPGVISTVIICFRPSVFSRADETSSLLPLVEPRVLVNVTRLPRVLPPESVGWLPDDLPSDLQSGEVDVDASFGPRDRPRPRRSKSSSFGRF
jgi:hypothetical protein